VSGQLLMALLFCAVSQYPEQVLARANGCGVKCAANFSATWQIKKGQTCSDVNGLGNCVVKARLKNCAVANTFAGAKCAVRFCRIFADVSAKCVAGQKCAVWML